MNSAATKTFEQLKKDGLIGLIRLRPNAAPGSSD